VFEQQHSPPTLPSRYRAHQAGRPGAHDHNVKRFHRRGHYARPYAAAQGRRHYAKRRGIRYNDFRRTKMAIEYRAEVIGSMLRPGYLKDARKRWRLDCSARWNSSRSKIARSMK
jgi:hypothetical protein